MEAKPETKRDILAAAVAAGLRLTAPQLARLHRAGAIAKPETISLGRGKGRSSVYPAGTATQVFRLVELSGQERRLPERAWLAWWLDGGRISDAARAYLNRAARELDALVETMRALQRGEVVEIDGREIAIDDLYAAAENERLAGVLGRARARTGRDRFSSVVAFLIQLSSGEFERFPLDRVLGTSEPEWKLIEVALGLTRARQDAISGHEPWLAGDLEGDFARLAQQLKDISFVRQACESDVLLNCARVELQAMIDVVGGAADFFDTVFGQGAFSYRELAESLAPRGYRDQIFALLAWSRMRRDRRLREGMVEVTALRGLVSQMRNGLSIVERLRMEIPALAPLLTSERLATAMLNASEMARLQSALGEARGLYAEEIESALSSNVAVDKS